MRAMIAAIALVASIGSASADGYGKILAGFAIAEMVCGYDVPDDAENLAFVRAMQTRTIQELTNEIETIMRMVMIEFQDGASKIDFCIEIGKNFK